MSCTARAWPRTALTLSRPPRSQKARLGRPDHVVTPPSEDLTARWPGLAGGSGAAGGWMRERAKMQSSGKGLVKATSTVCKGGQAGAGSAEMDSEGQRVAVGLRVVERQKTRTVAREDGGAREAG